MLNLQGDVIAITNYAGARYGYYQYDAWGNIIYQSSNSLLRLNPLRYRGYVYDSESGFYYCQSRYYDPAIGRFINADSFVSTGQDFIGYNMFAYCGNNPIIRVDTNGEAFETVFDVASLIVSALEVAANPGDIGAWAGLLGDTVDLVPFVTGVGESIRALRAAGKIADAADATIDTYRNLRKVAKGTGKEVHHILEKRFVSQLGLNIDDTSDMFSIVLTKADHRAYTNQWRKLSYGKKHTINDVIATGVRMYSKDPDIMAAFLLTL